MTNEGDNMTDDHVEGAQPTEQKPEESSAGQKPIEAQPAAQEQTPAPAPEPTPEPTPAPTSTSKPAPVKKEADAEIYNIYVMGKLYRVPVGFTIMKAIEYAGYQYIRSCGCRAGFCGACSTVYRKEGEQKLNFALACQQLVEEGMNLVQIPFVPANKAKYDINELKPEENTILSFYPEIARCVSCNTCTKSCPQDINVMMYIQNALRGDIAKAAELSFDCIQCGMCAMRCPADIKHYHVAQLARRLRGKYLDTRSENLKTRLAEVESKKFDGDIDGMVAADDVKIRELYSARKIEAEGEDVGGGLNE